LLIGARVLQAIGAALLLPASLAIVLAAFPASRRAIVVSLWGAVGGLAAALGPSIGSWVVDAWGWPWAFYINLPLGALSLWRGRHVLEESRNPENAAPLDVIGVLLLIAGVGPGADGIARLGFAGRARLPRRRRGRARALRRLGPAHAVAGDRSRAVRESDLPLGQPRHPQLRHRLRDDVLRLLHLQDRHLALLAAACRSR